MGVINLNEWKEVRNAKGGIMSILEAMDRMGVDGSTMDIRHLKDFTYSVTGEFFSSDILLKAVEDLLATNAINAVICDDINTVIIQLANRGWS